MRYQPPSPRVALAIHTDNVYCRAYELDDFIFLENIQVLDSDQGKGLGSVHMRKLIAHANVLGKPIYLTASPLYDDCERPRLERFYRRIGFVDAPPPKRHKAAAKGAMVYYPDVTEKSPASVS